MNSDTEDEDLTCAPQRNRTNRTYHDDDTADEDEDLSVVTPVSVPVARPRHFDVIDVDFFSFSPLPHPLSKAAPRPKEPDSTFSRAKRPRAVSLDSESEPDLLPAHFQPESQVLQQNFLSESPLNDYAGEEDVLQDDKDIYDYGEKPKFIDVTPVNPKVDVLLGREGDNTVIPGCTAQWLRPYQIDGVLFLYDMYTNGTGGILGDDMGLGKTVQVIAFLNAVFGKNGSYEDWKRMRSMRSAGKDYPVVMIICPGTLIQNWLNELTFWSWTHVVKYHGVAKQEALLAIAQGRSEVLITTYTTYKNNAEALNQVKWSVVIADECHLIKEPKSRVTLYANQINSKVRIGLTGTAIQNNYDELYTLLNWANPGKYGTAGFWKANVSAVLKNGQKHNATNWELTNARTRALELAKDLLPQVLLRRTKALIAHQLPKKTDKVVFCPLTKLQITAYDNLMGSEEVVYLRDSKKACDCGSGLSRQICCYSESPGGQSFADLLFPYLHYLRNLSNHMALCLPKPGDQHHKRARDQSLLEEALPDTWQVIAARTPMQNGCDSELCGKWKVLQKLLRFWKGENCKVLIFSSSVKLLDMLNDLMMQENYLYEYLHGGMSLEARSAAVDNFNNNPQQFIFLISTRAGGVGLNIVSANKVVIFDPNWNPAHDLQAQDRAYRIGQRRDVEVYRLISVGTVEEVVYARQIYKQQQANIGYEASEERRYFRGVQGDSGQRGELFGVENLMSFHGENHVLKAIFNETSAAESEFEDVLMANIDISATQENIQDMDAHDEFGINAIVKAEVGETTSASYAVTATTNTNESSIASILAAAGVSYSHKNNEIVGRSKIEVEITKVAAKAAQDAGHRNREAYLATILRTQRRQIKVEKIEKAPRVKSEDVGASKKRTLPWASKR